ncbi:MAG TPA: efflux RND transporter periplasmic adaptor subunit [Xanthobacteraceae bacterium]|nr:efflux RND transporter periplasmic adaptor subunit [Xanthobacteraceae bacterium]
MKLGRILPIFVVIAVVAAVGGYVVMGKQQEQQKQKRARAFQDQPAPVLVAPARSTDVPIYLDAVGNSKALNTATVRPQVGGQIVKILFREGQDVKRGDVLAEIDPRTYQAQYDQAVAKKAQDEATLANARIDLDRYTKLAASNSGSKQQADTQKALVAQLEAQVQGDQAAIDNTRAMLSYTKITAPFDGRTGLRLVDEGNLVQANDATGVVVITQIQPISVIFNLPQQQYQQVSKAFAQGTLPVDAIAADGKTVLDRGTLQVIDNQMDQTTGTIRMKAEFPNKDLQLWPGQFVNVRVLVETLKQVVVVPVSAVQRGPSGTFVYAVDADSKAVVRAVKVGQQDDTSAVIPEGLKPDERVVTTGFTRLSNGTRVRVQAGEGEAGASDTPPAPSPAPSERRRKRDGGAGAENTDGKERRRSENTASPPSTRQ